MDLSALGRSVSASGVYRPVHKPRPVLPSGPILVRADRRAGKGPVLRRTLLRRSGSDRLFKHPDHQHQLCGVCRGKLLSEIPGLLQPVQRWRCCGRYRYR